MAFVVCTFIHKILIIPCRPISATPTFPPAFSWFSPSQWFSATKGEILTQSVTAIFHYSIDVQSILILKEYTYRPIDLVAQIIAQILNFPFCYDFMCVHICHSIKGMNFKQLQKELKTVGLKAGGKKAALVTRLINYMVCYGQFGVCGSFIFILFGLVCFCFFSYLQKQQKAETETQEAVQDTPTVEAEAGVETEPAPEEASIPEEEAAADEEPVAKEEPAAEEGQVVEEEPVAEEPVAEAPLAPEPAKSETAAASSVVSDLNPFAGASANATDTASKPSTQDFTTTTPVQVFSC